MRPPAGSVLSSKEEFVDFVNSNKIPLLFMFDENRLPSADNIPTVVCLKRNAEKIKSVLPICYSLEIVPDMIELEKE